MKKILISLCSVFLVCGMLFSHPLATVAAEIPDFAEGKIFIPFRSDLVNYISNHAYESNEIIQGLWKKLFYEETHWNSSEKYYDSRYAKFSDKYYGDYVKFGGGIQSSKGTNMTYDPDFVNYLVVTFEHNPEFFTELLSDKAGGMNQVMETYLAGALEKYPALVEYIMDETASGKWIGTGMNDSNNLMRKYGVDYKILSIYAGKWDEINSNQQKWCESYLSYIYSDYVSHHDDGKSIAQNTISKKKYENRQVAFKPLYDMLARSSYGASTGKYQQEFFDYVVGTPNDISSGLLPHGLGEWLSLQSGITDSRLKSIETIYDIFSDEAHCPLGCSKCGAPASYNNLLAYNITYSSSSVYANIRNLISKNEYALNAMNAWRDHYEYIHSSVNGSLSNTYSINWSDHDEEDHGWHGQGYSVSCSSHVDGTVNLSDKLSSSSSKIEIVVQAESFNAQLYNGKNQLLTQASGNGHVNRTDIQNVMLLDISNFSTEELKGAYLKISADSHDSAHVDNDSCTGALSNVNVYSITIHRTIANCYATNPPHHSYRTEYVWSTDYSLCVGYAFCAHDKSHTAIAYSTSVKHTQDANYDYYTPVFPSQSGIEAKMKVVKKPNAPSSQPTININDKTKITGTIYAKDESKSGVFHGEGVTRSSFVTGSFSIVAGAIPSNANAIKLYTKCGCAELKVYYEGEPVATYAEGRSDWYDNHEFTIDLSRYSSKQLEKLYVVCTMTTSDHCTWAYGYGEEYQSISEIALQKVEVLY